MLVPYKAEHIPFLPEKCRPLLRYRREEFGFLAAFPNGRVGMFEEAAEPLLQQDDVIISVSLDGIHGAGAPTGESDFDAVTRKLLKIRSYGFNTSIMTTTTHENLGDLQTFVNFAIDNDISLRSVPFVPMGRGK